MRIHLVDGTYELFRAYFGAPPRRAPDGREVGATLGLLNSLVALLSRPGVTHVGCAFDHVIESFRNDLYGGYKTSAGVPPDLLAQFTLAEEVTRALGLVVWPMVEFEADDAIATMASRAGADPRVEQVVICSPDKDFAQLVDGTRVVIWDRRRDIVYDAATVQEKFGVPPAAIPEWLALVGDSADGYPGIPGWGEKSAALVLSRYGRLADLPDNPALWGLGGRTRRLADSLHAHHDDLALFRALATLRHDVPLIERIDDLEWRGATGRLRTLAAELGERSDLSRIPRWQQAEPER